MRRLDLNSSPLSWAALEYIIETLRQDGEIEVVGYPKDYQGNIVGLMSCCKDASLHDKVDKLIAEIEKSRVLGGHY